MLSLRRLPSVPGAGGLRTPVNHAAAPKPTSGPRTNAAAAVTTGNHTLRGLEAPPEAAITHVAHPGTREKESGTKFCSADFPPIAPPSFTAIQGRSRQKVVVRLHACLIRDRTRHGYNFSEICWDEMFITRVANWGRGIDTTGY
eukprot:scaffold11630_cov60-Phaeocystis_antarctica.AAC.3